MSDAREKAARALWKHEWGVDQDVFPWTTEEREIWLKAADACLAAALVIDDEDVETAVRAYGRSFPYNVVNLPAMRAALAAFVARKLGK